jgi:flavin-dependent thymidylate synthase
MDFSRLDTSDKDNDPILRDIAFNRRSMNEDGRHTSPEVLRQARVDIGVDNIRVDLIQGINEEDFSRVNKIALRATTGVDPDMEREALWDELLKGGLQTSLETQTVVFLVTGVSRALTHQLVRTRKASFHQQSQRATFMGYEPNVRMPESVWRNPAARHAFLIAVHAAREAYATAVQEDIAFQDARYILPERTETQILCEYPLREFLNTYAYRACSMFLWEHIKVFRTMGQLLIAEHPWLKPYVKISCETSHRCTFMGWEKVDEQCDFEWGTEANRNYKPDRSLTIG